MRLLVVLGLLLAAGSALSRCALIVQPSVTWHQRLTLTVDTFQGPVSASSVTAVTAQDNTGLFYAPPEAAGLQSEFSSEAVALEVAPGRWLFALLDGAGGGWAWAAFDLGVREGPAASFRLLRRLPPDAPVPLPPGARPRLVTFDDVADPASVRRVDPDDLAATFGPEVRLREMTLAVIEAEVTEGRIQTVLDWIDDLARYRTDPDNPFTNIMPTEISYLRRQ